MARNDAAVPGHERPAVRIKAIAHSPPGRRPSLATRPSFAFAVAIVPGLSCRHIQPRRLNQASGRSALTTIKAIA
jgi:hypothetical protein